MIITKRYNGSKPAYQVTIALTMRSLRALIPATMLALLTLVISNMSELSAQSLPPYKDAVIAAVEAQRNPLKSLANDLWNYSEISLREHASARLVSSALEAHGFKVQRGVGGLPTAFVASYGSGRPVIAILAEYDALPGVGNEAVPRREARADNNPNGHGCGHNLFAAGSVTAAIAIKKIMQEYRLNGTIRLYGTPAEETVIGKVYMAKAGLFDDVDASLDWHAGTETKISNQSGQAMNNFEVEFFGRAAHAATAPWSGRSALDAVEMMNFGANLLREHIQPTARIHYVITRGGEAPNVVPEYAKVWYYVRDTARPSVDEYYKRLQDIARGAALATNTEYKINLVTGVHEKLLNRPLQEAMQANLESVGAPDFSQLDHAFARQLQETLAIAQTGFDTTVTPLKPEPEPMEGGSTDLAEVSWITPAATVYVATAPAGVPGHSWAATASYGNNAAVRGTEVAAKVLALTALDLLTDEKLLGAARAFFHEKTGGRPYLSPLPREQKPPLPGEK